MTGSDLLSLPAGTALSALFALVRLPVPAPTTLGGVLGVVGVAMGAYLVSIFR